MSDRVPPQRASEPQKDLYDYYQPDGGPVPPQQQMADRLPAQRQQYDYAPPTQQLYNEAYAYGPQQQYRPDARAMRIPSGDNNINMIVNGDVYIVQNGDCNARGGMNYDYRQPGGQCYDYRQYTQPYRDQQPNYYQQPYRPGCQTGPCYDYSQGYPRNPVYREQPVYQYPVQRSGWEAVQRGPQYSNDTVHGGPGGYTANRQRYDGGWSRQGDAYYGTPPFNPNGGGGGGGGFFDGFTFRDLAQLGLGVYDSHNAHDIARRHARNQQQAYNPGGRPYYPQQGGGGVWNPSNPNRAMPRNYQYYR